MINSAKDKAIKVDWVLIGQRLTAIVIFLKWPVVILLAAFILDHGRWDFQSIHLDASIVLSYIQALSWPVVASAALLMLKPHLREIINRLRKVGVGQTIAELAPPSQRERTSPEVAQLVGEDENKQPAEDSSTDTDASLHNQLTSPQARLAFEQIYNDIFGSQLAILKRLKDHLETGLSKEDMLDLYESHVASKDPAYPSFESFMQYLLDNILVLYDIEDKRYKLTNAGVYFLLYLSDTGVYQRFRPF